MQTLLLVDGSSYLYRAYHALPDLRNHANEPTGAIYGVLNMLRRLAKDHTADYSACVFDAKGKTFRDDWYPEYKAHRPPMPDDLSCQIAPLHEAIRAMGWPLLMVEGVEADDVIGTLARQATEQGWNTIISTGDKDLAQLVNERVKLVNTMTNETLDIPGVKNKFGVPPEGIVDYLTLIGDAVDNVPGVEKCGPKTALKWLEAYGTLDNLIAHADEITGKVGENLRAALDWLPQGRRLITVKTDVENLPPLHELHFVQADKPHLAEFFNHYDFKSWREELGDVAGTPVAAAPAAQRHYHQITRMAELDEWVGKLKSAGSFVFDTETTSLDEMQARLVGLSFAVEPHEAIYIPLNHRYPGAPEQLDEAAVLAKLAPLFADPAIRKIGQNLKYDLHVLANHGITVNGLGHDTLLESYVLESHKTHDMDSLAARHLGVKTITYEEIAGKGAQQIGFDQVDVDTATDYSAEDADITLQLHQTLWPQIEQDEALKRVYSTIELPLVPVLLAIERQGVLLDSAVLAKQSQALGERLLQLEQEAYELAGQPFNLNSPKQIQEILFERQGLPVIKKTPGGAPSTDEEVLQQLALDYPLPKVLLESRSLSKLKSTYTDKLPRMVNPNTGRVHTRFSQAVAVTGRLSSSDPNLQNIPVRTQEGRRIREAFIAPPGWKLVSADYSQIELRIMAHLSGDANLIRAFAAGEDVHRATAAEIFSVTPLEVDAEQRRVAKVINFGLIYGMSAFGLVRELGITRAAAQQYIDRYFERYPGVAAYMQRTREAAKTRGYVETVFGRRLWLPDITSKNGAKRQAAERAAINAPMQGTAADLIKLSMIAVQDWLEKSAMQTRLVLQVHDELVLEAPESELATVLKEVPRLMAGVAQLQVPLLAEIGSGNNWGEAH